MGKFLAIIEDTIREGLAKKTIIGMFIVSTVGLVIGIFVFQMDSVQSGLLSPASTAHPKGPNASTLNLVGVTVLDFVWMSVSLALLGMSVFLGVFATAGFITSMMEKGTIDLLLSKPVPRWMYVAGRYTGAVLIVLVEVSFLLFGLWLIAGLSIGAWSPAFLVGIPLITLTFAGVYALVTLIGILTRSSWFAIILGLAVFMLAGAILPIAQFIDRLINGDSSGGILSVVGNILHYSIPQANDIAGTMRDVLLHQPVHFGPIAIALGLIAAYVGLSTFAFSRKEF